MSDYIWLTDKESGEPALFKTEAIDAAYVREDKVEGFSHIGGSTQETTGGPETRVLLRMGTYIAVKETPQQVYALMQGDRSITDA